MAYTKGFEDPNLRQQLSDVLTQKFGIPAPPPAPKLPTTPTVQKGGMVDIPAGYNYSSTQGLYKATPGLTDAQMNTMSALTPMTAEQTMARQNDLASQMQALYQPRIDAISGIYESILADARQRALQREARTRAIATSKGIMTTGAGEAQLQEAEKVGQKELSSINAEKNLAIQEVYGKMNEDAKERLKAERAEQLGLADKALEIKNQLATKSMERLKTLGAAGIDLKQLKSNAEVYKNLQEGTGMSDLELDAYLRTNQGDNIVKSGVQDLGNGVLIGYTLDKNGKWTTNEFKSDIKPGEAYKEIDGVPYAMTTSPDGTLVMRKISGYEESPDKALERQLKQSQIAKNYQDLKGGAGTVATAGSTYGSERARRAIESIDEILPEINAFTTGGIGWASRGIPGTSAFNLNSKITTLKSAIAQNELAAMRASSKTGGALGSVSEKELALLENALGSLDTAQSTDQIYKQLEKVKKSIERWESAGGDASAPQQGEIKVKITATGEEGFIPANEFDSNIYTKI